MYLLSNLCSKNESIKLLRSLYKRKLSGKTVAHMRSLPPAKKAAEAHLMRAYLQVLFIKNSIDPFKFALIKILHILVEIAT